ncbi:MAG: glycosyl hydrolase family 2 [Prevotella sp.]|nr:glycosyl hydrolase family 2 [Prevotella sp.]
MKTAFFKIVLFFVCLLSTSDIMAQQWPTAKPEAKAGSRWWWLGSAVDEDNLKWCMQQYASYGIGTLEITPLYGVQGNDLHNIPFLSERWMEILKFCEDEGRRDGIQIDMNCGTGWPFGGPDVPIEEAACKVVIVDTVVSHVQMRDLLLAVPPKEKPYSSLQVAMAFSVDVPKYTDRKITKVSDVTQAVADGHLRLRNVDEGSWRIIALYASRTLQKVKRAAPGGEGWVLDHFDKDAVAHYLQRFDNAFHQTGTPYPHSFFNDSYEVHHADWTPTLLREFEKRRGYKLEYRLQQFVDGDPKVLHDFRETLSDLLLENFTNQWVEWSHRHGVTVRNQAHGSPANLIDVYAAVDIPEIEGFGLSDFGIKGLRRDPGMTRKNDSDLSMLKYASSAAHITGKQFTSSESMTWLTEHFRTSLSQMKPDMDLLFCAGVNRMFFHGTCYSPKDDPWPGWKFYASIDMSPTNSIWRDAPSFLKYIERCQSFLQWGQPDNDFLVYLPVHDMWSKKGEELLMQFAIHSMDKRAPEFIHTILDIDSLGFDCDYISDKYLLTTTFDGKMLRTAAGVPYKALLIPDNCIMPDHVRAHIRELKEQGACVIQGIRPAEMSAVARPEKMKTDLGLNMIRRKNDKGYHYFIANLTPVDVWHEIALAVDFKDAMWFDPMTGMRYAVEKNGNKIKIALRSGESMILETFDKEEPACSSLGKCPCLSTDNGIAEKHALQRGWSLSFIESTPAVVVSYPIDTLTTWEGLDSRTRSLMGTGVYECVFKMSKKALRNKEYWQVDLGDVRESARVSINGHDIGCAWAVPYVLTFDSSVLKSGNNTIRIEVTNLPANRISQLDKEGVNWRKFNEINFVDIKYNKSSYAHWSPLPSGLNGNVYIYPLR